MKLIITALISILAITAIAQKVPIRKQDGSVAKPATANAEAKKPMVKASGGSTTANAGSANTQANRPPIKTGGGDTANANTQASRPPVKAGGSTASKTTTTTASANKLPVKQSNGAVANKPLPNSSADKTTQAVPTASSLSVKQAQAIIQKNAQQQDASNSQPPANNKQ